MRRGEETLMPNWALDAIERMTLAADIRILTFLVRHRHYRSNTYSTRQLAIALEIDLRTIQASTVRLMKEGLILGLDGLFCCGEASSRVQGVRKTSAKTLQKDSRAAPVKPVQHDENGSLNKGTDELMKKEEHTPLTPQGGEARKGTAPGGNEVGTPAATGQEHFPPDGGAADAAADDLPGPVQVETRRPARGKSKATSTEDVPPGAPTPFQELFIAVALACYGGHEDLTNTARSRVATAAKSLNGARFVAADIPRIVAWLREHESWRDALTPQVLEERAPVWRADLRGSLPPRVGKGHVVKFTPRPRTTEEANTRFVANMAANADAVRGVFDD